MRKFFTTREWIDGFGTGTSRKSVTENGMRTLGAPRHKLWVREGTKASIFIERRPVSRQFDGIDTDDLEFCGQKIKRGNTFRVTVGGRETVHKDWPSVVKFLLKHFKISPKAPPPKPKRVLPEWMQKEEQAKKERAAKLRKAGISASKYRGDDQYSWAVFVNGTPAFTGLARSSVAYYQKLAYEKVTKQKL